MRSSIGFSIRVGFTLLCGAFLAPQADAQIGPPPPSVPKNSPRFAAAIKAFFNGTASGVPARICAAGDSTTFGVGSNASMATGLNVYSYPTQLAQALANYGVPAAQNGAIGDQGVNQNLTSDSRWSIGAAWYQATGQESLGGRQLVTYDTTTVTSFTPTGGVDTFRIFYLQTPTGGTIAYQIDGGAWTNVSEAGTQGLTSFTVSAGSTGTHTITFKYVSGQAPSWSVNIQGVEGYSAGVPQVSIVNMGWSGSKTSDWAVTSNAQSPGNSQPWTVLGCTVTILNLGINDEQTSTGMTPAQTLANMQTIIGAIQASGSDVLVVAPNPVIPSSSPQTRQASFMAAVKQAAAAMGVPVLSIFDKWGNFSNMQTNGLDFDNYHPSRQGYADIAQYIASALVPTGYAFNPFGGSWQSNTPFFGGGFLTFGSAVTGATGAADAGITRSGPDLFALGNGTLNDGSGTLQLQGIQFNKSGQACKTSAYTMVTNDNFVCVNATSAAIQITLPACGSGTYGQDYFVEKTDSSSNAVTIGNTTDTVNGASGTSAVSLSSQYQVTHLRCQASATWYRLQ